jgi:hypothetical protein
MKRVSTLEARRRALLARCDEQRIQLSYSLARLQSGRQLLRATSIAPRAAGSNPIVWVGAALSLLLLARPRKLLTWVAWLTGAISLISRVARVVRLINDLRGARLAR